MYFNPEASSWSCVEVSDPNVLKLHRTLPRYAATPLRRLPKFLCDELGASEVLVKDESDRFGLPAFKILGASWACYKSIAQYLGLGRLTGKEDLGDIRTAAAYAVANTRLRFFAATDGNHGRAVARMGKILGVRSCVFVPRVMLETTKDLIREEGAEVTVVDGDYDKAVHEADKQCRERGGILIQDDGWPGYEEVPNWIVQGYSTMMHEIDQQTTQLLGERPSIIITPVGVGSLAHAVVSHYKAEHHQATILAVEPDTAACLKTSLENGMITSIRTGNTSMCGLNCGTVSYTAWPYLRAGIDACTTVTDQQAQAAQEILKGFEISVGPCAAAALAALRKLEKDEKEELGIDGQSVVVLLATEGPR